MVAVAEPESLTLTPANGLPLSPSVTVPRTSAAGWAASEETVTDTSTSSAPIILQNFLI